MINGKPDIIESIRREGFDLKRRGRNYWSRCPFHDERTPSFMVNPNRQYYHCFGCGNHGDVITFIMQYRNLSFQDAIDHLKIDGKSSLKLNPQEKKRKDLLAAYRSWLHSFYRQLCKQEQVLYNLMKRSRGHPFQNEDIAWEYAELISELPLIGMKIDILWNGSEEDKLTLFIKENQTSC